MEKRNIFLAEFAMVIVTIIWGFVFPIAQLAIDAGYGTYSILFFRFGIAVVILPVVFRKRLKYINKELIKARMTVGIILFFGFFMQTRGLVYTTPSKNAFITLNCGITLLVIAISAAVNNESF